MGTGALLGRVLGETRCAFWLDEPTEHDFDPTRLVAAVDDVLATGGKTGRIPHLWDGATGPRAAAALSGRWSR